MKDMVFLSLLMFHNINFFTRKIKIFVFIIGFVIRVKKFICLCTVTKNQKRKKKILVKCRR